MDGKIQILLINVYPEIKMRLKGRYVCSEYLVYENDSIDKKKCMKSIVRNGTIRSYYKNDDEDVEEGILLTDIEDSDTFSGLETL